MKIIMLCGYARSGKDTVFRSIQRQVPGAKRYAFADALKQEVADAFGTSVHEIEKRKPEFRELLQAWGDGRRKIDSPDYWIEQVISSIYWDRPRLAVITDTRYPNEIAALNAAFPNDPDFGGVLDLWVQRKGVGPANAHATETAFEGYHFNSAIINNGSLEELDQTVREVLEGFDLIS